MFETSGNIASLGNQGYEGAQVVLEQINKGGGINGRPVELIQALYRPDKYEYRVNLSRDNGDAPRWTVKMVK